MMSEFQTINSIPATFILVQNLFASSGSRNCVGKGKKNENILIFRNLFVTYFTGWGGGVWSSLDPLMIFFFFASWHH